MKIYAMKVGLPFWDSGALMPMALVVVTILAGTSPVVSGSDLTMIIINVGNCAIYFIVKSQEKFNIALCSLQGDSSKMDVIEAMCGDYPAALEELNSSAECYLGPEMCSHVYRNTVRGLAGHFSEDQLELVMSCLGPSAEYYTEPDGVVSKMEDENLFKPLRRPRSRRLLNTRSILNSEPFVQTLTEFEKDSSIDGGAIDMWALAQGQPLFSPTEKYQELNPKLWNLDRIDQKDLPLNGEYTYGQQGDPGLGDGVTIYVVDTGIKLDHQEFVGADGLTSRASYGWNFVEGNGEADDKDGHGSHVAGVAAGLQVGVAKGAHLVAVRMLNEYGLGTVSDTVAALDWVAAKAAEKKGPNVVTMSLGVTSGNYSKTMEMAVKSLVVDHGVTVVVAAGNMGGDACRTSPALVPEAITVAASDLPGKYKNRTVAKTESVSAKSFPSSSSLSSFDDAVSGPVVTASTPSSENQDGNETVYEDGNQGACVDLFAPGVDIWSVCGGLRRCGVVTSDTYAYASGTSMAVPHVAGAAALYLSRNPTASPAEVTDVILRGTSQGKISPSVLKPKTPNKLLMTRTTAPPAAVKAAQGP